MTPLEFRTIRLALGLTQQELAVALGVKRLAVSRLECGHVPIDLRTELALQHLSCRPKRSNNELKTKEI